MSRARKEKRLSRSLAFTIRHLYQSRMRIIGPLSQNNAMTSLLSCRLDLLVRVVHISVGKISHSVTPIAAWAPL